MLEPLILKPRLVVLPGKNRDLRGKGAWAPCSPPCVVENAGKPLVNKKTKKKWFNHRVNSTEGRPTVRTEKLTLCLTQALSFGRSSENLGEKRVIFYDFGA